jgi:hypothetical protein
MGHILKNHDELLTMVRVMTHEVCKLKFVDSSQTLMYVL